MLKFFVFLALVSLEAYALSSKEFDQVLKNNSSVIFHVHADWCPTCKIQKKTLSVLPNKNFKLVEINFDDDKEVLRTLNVHQQSTLVSFVDGKERARKSGITSKGDIMNFIESSFEQKSLQNDLNERKSNSKAPKEAVVTMEQATEKLRSSGILNKARKKGDLYVDFTLPSADVRKTKLSEELKLGPVILTFYRGGWCPYCNLQLRAYQNRLEDFKAQGAKLIAISPENLNAAASTLKENKLGFEVLSDSGNQVARKYGIVFKIEDELKAVYQKFGIDLEKNQNNSAWELPLPATYVISRTGKILYSFLNVDYVQRAEPDDIIKALISNK